MHIGYSLKRFCVCIVVWVDYYISCFQAYFVSCNAETINYQLDTNSNISNSHDLALHSNVFSLYVYIFKSNSEI